MCAEFKIPDFPTPREVLSILLNTGQWDGSAIELYTYIGPWAEQLEEAAREAMGADWMDFETFQKTRKEVDSISKEIGCGDEDLDIPGFVYLDCVYIEKCEPGYHLHIESMEYDSENLGELEVILYQWAID